MHQHSHSEHSSTKIFCIAIAILFGFAIIEAIGGWFANSLALISDAGHIAADGVALILAAIANWIATKPASKQHSYGLGRAEVLGAWMSSLVMVLIAIFIGFEAIERIKQPQQILSTLVIVLGGLGVIINIVLLRVLNHSERTLNLRAALLHIAGDLLGSFAALCAGLVILFTGWVPIDALLSLFIAALILIGSFRLLKETLLVLMEGVPLHLDMAEVGNKMAKTPYVRAIHDLHIWTLSSGRIVLSAHVEVENLEQWQTILNNLRQLLSEDYQITHITLQPETINQILYPIKKPKSS